MGIEKVFQEFESRQTREPMLSPMIDMLFLLLLFFMVTTTFEKNEALSLKKAAAESGEQVKEKKMKILVDSTGSYWVGEEEYSKKKIVSRVKSFLKETSEGVVLIIPDKRGKINSFITLLDTLYVENIKSIDVGTEKKRKNSE